MTAALRQHAAASTGGRAGGLRVVHALSCRGHVVLVLGHVGSHVLCALDDVPASARLTRAQERAVAAVLAAPVGEPLRGAGGGTDLGADGAADGGVSAALARMKAASKDMPRALLLSLQETPLVAVQLVDGERGAPSQQPRIVAVDAAGTLWVWEWSASRRKWAHLARVGLPTAARCAAFVTDSTADGGLLCWVDPKSGQLLGCGLEWSAPPAAASSSLDSSVTARRVLRLQPAVVLLDGANVPAHNGLVAGNNGLWVFSRARDGERDVTQAWFWCLYRRKLLPVAAASAALSTEGVHVQRYDDTGEVLLLNAGTGDVHVLTVSRTTNPACERLCTLTRADTADAVCVVASRGVAVVATRAGASRIHDLRSGALLSEEPWLAEELLGAARGTVRAWSGVGPGSRAGVFSSSGLWQLRRLRGRGAGGVGETLVAKAREQLPRSLRTSPGALPVSGKPLSLARKLAARAAARPKGERPQSDVQPTDPSLQLLALAAEAQEASMRSRSHRRRIEAAEAVADFLSAYEAAGGIDEDKEALYERYTPLGVALLPAMQRVHDVLRGRSGGEQPGDAPFDGGRAAAGAFSPRDRSVSEALFRGGEAESSGATFGLASTALAVDAARRAPARDRRGVTQPATVLLRRFEQNLRLREADQAEADAVAARLARRTRSRSRATSLQRGRTVSASPARGAGSRAGGPGGTAGDGAFRGFARRDLHSALFHAEQRPSAASVGGDVDPSASKGATVFETMVRLYSSLHPDRVLDFVDLVDAKCPPSYKSVGRTLGVGGLQAEPEVPYRSHFERALLALPVVGPTGTLTLTGDAASDDKKLAHVRTYAEMLRAADRGVDAMRLLLRHDLWDDAMQLLADAELAQAPDKLRGERSFSLSSHYRSMTAGRGAAASEASLPRRTSQFSSKWSAPSKLTLAYFHELFSHAVRAGDAVRVRTLWAHLPPTYGVWAALATLDAGCGVAEARETSDGGGRASGLPADDAPVFAAEGGLALADMLPSLQRLSSDAESQLEELRRFWQRTGSSSGRGQILREWGTTHAPQSW